LANTATIDVVVGETLVPLPDERDLGTFTARCF